MDKCKYCQGEFPEGTNNNGRRLYCKGKCNSKSRYLKQSKNIKYLAGKRKQRVARKKKIKEFLNEIKLKSGCIDCGYKKYAIALDFDHVKGIKRMNLSQYENLERAKLEIEKCEVVCANCHRIRHMKKNNYN